MIWDDYGLSRKDWDEMNMDEFHKNMNDWNIKTYGETIEEGDKRVEKWWNEHPEMMIVAKKIAGLI